MQFANLSIQKWKAPEILLVVSALFMMAAIGFFVAVYFLQGIGVTSQTLGSIPRVSSTEHSQPKQ
jgi:hypothetical protein